MEKALPPIPAKRYFTIGEVSELCGVKPYVLRYWEQEFTQLKPMKRRGNRRYYQHHEVLLVRRIRDLLYDQGFTISGARNRLTELGQAGRGNASVNGAAALALSDAELDVEHTARLASEVAAALSLPAGREYSLQQVRQELLSIRDLLAP
jgi:DNA-binding transcriptional MerR regulator